MSAPSFKIINLLDRPIAYHRCFLPIAGSVAGAVFLSQLVYWSSRGKEKDGSIYKTRGEWEEETGLGRYEQESARRALRENGVLSEVKKGIPCRLYFVLNINKLASLLNSTNLIVEKPHTSLGETSKLECGFPTSKDAGKSQTITESTIQRLSESTTDINATFGVSQSQSQKKSKTETRFSREEDGKREEVENLTQSQNSETGRVKKTNLLIAECDAFPEVENRGVVADWYIHRAAKKAKVTQTVIDGFTREAAKAGYTIEKALRTSIERNWIGFDANWALRDLRDRGSNNGPGHHTGLYEKNYRDGLDANGRFILGKDKCAQ